MTQLDGKTRARLPDSAFAYIDSRGGRRLPINDEAHVRGSTRPPSRAKQREIGRG